ncbi:MAG: protein-glutamate O-methyltransferase CheR [Bdellovibrionaceae bacterium]|nr:protein-glutamate O-methyltransferase CheR [Pseudobdellovibrionaceae bacterium]
MNATAKILAGTTTPELSDQDLNYFSEVIERRAGIALKPAKRDLIRTRLRSRIAALSFASYEEYRHHLASLPKDDPEWQEFTNLLTTNKTDFFREAKHFEFMVQTILPQWLKTNAQTFNVWSAASSTGEEAYTLAMLLDRHLPAGRSFKILATDIDTEVVATAKNSVYAIAKKPEIPVEFHSTCLDFGKGDARGWFRMKPHLREKIQFRQHNLIESTAPGEAVFDLVLCRNVLIYFNPENIDFVQKKIFRTVKPGGYFFIGHSESLQGFKHQWNPLGPSIFGKPGA